MPRRLSGTLAWHRGRPDSCPGETSMKKVTFEHCAWPCISTWGDRGRKGLPQRPLAVGSLDIVGFRAPRESENPSQSASRNERRRGGEAGNATKHAAYTCTGHFPQVDRCLRPPDPGYRCGTVLQGRDESNTHTQLTLADQSSHGMLFVLDLLVLFTSFNSDVIFLANCKATACLRVRYFGGHSRYVKKASLLHITANLDGLC